MTQTSRTFETSSLLLRALAPAERQRLLNAGTRRSFSKGTTIFLKGDNAQSMGLIEEGRVEISLTSFAGRRTVLNHMGPGEILGEIAMLDGGTRSADATAATDVTLSFLMRTDVMGVLSRNPDSMLSLISELCAKVRNASDMFSLQSEMDARTRLAQSLLRIGRKWGQAKGDEIHLPSDFTQLSLGEFAGLARENVNRHLRNWAGDGTLEIRQGEIILLDLDALRAVAEG